MPISTSAPSPCSSTVTRDSVSSPPPHHVGLLVEATRKRPSCSSKEN